MSKPVHYDIEAFRKQAEEQAQTMFARGRAMARSDRERALVDLQERMSPMCIELSAISMECHNRGEGDIYAQSFGAFIGLAIKTFNDNCASPLFMTIAQKAIDNMLDDEPGEGSFRETREFSGTEGGNA